MKLETITQKMDDLAYRIKLDEMAISNAQYNLKHAKRLNYTEKQIDSFASKLDFYNSKIITDRNTLNVLTQYKADFESGKDFTNANDGYLFKCTFPYEKVDGTSNYQTSILVNDNVVGLFANGVSYKDVVCCLDSEDVASIQSTFSSVIPNESANEEVKVELIDDDKAVYSKDMPILAKQRCEASPSLIASSKIFSCYPGSNVSYKDLDGNLYMPGVPSFESICNTQSKTNLKQKELDNLTHIESAVKEKMQNSIDRINLMLDFTDAGYSLGDDFFLNK